MKRASHGYVLPFVLIAIAAASVLAFSLASEGWHSARAVALAGHGDAAANAVEDAQAMAMDRWELDSVWVQPLHQQMSRTVVTTLGRSVRLTWNRSHPLMAWLTTSHYVDGNARRAPIGRELLRAVWLQAPAIPVNAALVIPGAVTGAEGTLISGADVATPGSACGVSRDTASVSAVAATSVLGDPLGSWPGAPVPDTLAQFSHDSLSAALMVIHGRAEHRVVGNAPSPFPVRAGWNALWLTGNPVIIEGPTHWTGLVVVDGALELRGNVAIDGLLLVRGALDARAARWQMQGAVMSTDTVTGGARLGTQTRIFYDRCAMQMALATVARPLLTTFSLWQPLAQ